jgi:hypothetical protein
LSGVWFGLATVAIGLVIRWVILNDPGRSGRKLKFADERRLEAPAENPTPDRRRNTKRWRAGN